MQEAVSNSLYRGLREHCHPSIDVWEFLQFFAVAGGFDSSLRPILYSHSSRVHATNVYKHIIVEASCVFRLIVPVSAHLIAGSSGCSEMAHIVIDSILLAFLEREIF